MARRSGNKTAVPRVLAPKNTRQCRHPRGTADDAGVGGIAKFKQLLVRRCVAIFVLFHSSLRCGAILLSDHGHALFGTCLNRLFFCVAKKTTTRSTGFPLALTDVEPLRLVFRGNCLFVFCLVFFFFYGKNACPPFFTQTL